MDANEPTPEFWDYPGETDGPFTFNDGTNPHNAPGNAGCRIGLIDWFRDGVPVGEVFDINTVPACCGDWTPVGPPPTVGNISIIAGNPDITTPIGNAYWGNLAICAIVWTGSNLLPPSIPAGWSAIVNQPITSTDGWYMLISKNVIDIGEVLSIDGGSLFFGTATLYGMLPAGALIVDDQQSTFTNLAFVPVPNATAALAGTLSLGIVFRSPGGFVSVTGGYTLIGGQLTGSGSGYQVSLDSVGPGVIVGPTLWSGGILGDGRAVHLLIR